MMKEGEETVVIFRPYVDRTLEGIRATIQDAHLWCSQIASVLHYLHVECAMAHGGVTLNNVFVDRQNQIILGVMQPSGTFENDLIGFKKCAEYLGSLCELAVTKSFLSCTSILEDLVCFEKKRTVLLYSVGSRGDVNPYLALGEMLLKRGYHVRLATLSEFRPVVEAFGIEFCEIHIKASDIMALMVADGIMDVQFLAKSYTSFRAMMTQIMDDMFTCVVPHQKYYEYKFVVAHPAFPAGVHFAEYLKVHLITLMTMPWTATAEVPHPSAPMALFPKLSYLTYGASAWFSSRDVLNKYRSEKLHLPLLGITNSEYSTSNIMLHDRLAPFIYTWSPRLLPKPSDWGSHTMVSGFMLTCAEKDQLISKSNSNLEPCGFHDDPELNVFLNNALGNPPIFIGFGSVNATRAIIRNIARNVVRSLHWFACTDISKYVIIQVHSDRDTEIWETELNDRANMCTEIMDSETMFARNAPPMFRTSSEATFWDKNVPMVEQDQSEKAWSSLRSKVLIIRQARHSLLFPLCSVVVHHGGIGTFSTTAFTGTPQIVVPFFFDQFLWGFCVDKLGTGKMIRSAEFSFEKLLEALEYCATDVAKKHSVQLRDSLIDEIMECDPANMAIDAIELWLKSDNDIFDISTTKLRQGVSWGEVFPVKEERTKKTDSSDSRASCTGDVCNLM